MALPKIEYPVYELKIPSTGKEIKVRPFIVKEEKLLLMAVESKDENEIINTTKQVIGNCILEGDVDIDKLPFFDIDYIFIALRAKSIGEKIDMQFICNNVVNENICGHIFEAPIDIANAVIENKDDMIKDISLSNNITVKMKYPPYSVMKIISGKEDNLERKIKVICTCIESIVQDDKIYTSKDYTREELNKFVSEMTEDNFKKMENFVDNFPRFAVHAGSTCPKCNYNHKIEYRDFTSFFQ